MSDLLERAIHAHGGLERWRQVQRFEAKMSIAGGVLQRKGHPDGFKGVLLQVDMRRPEVSIRPYAPTGGVAYIQPYQRVWTEDAEGRLVDDLPTPRSSLSEHTLTMQWSRPQLLYFVGYALWNYFSTPFIFTEPGFEVSELGPHEEGGEILDRLKVRFPSDYPTHSQEQVLYFSQAGLLQRLDYEVVIAGRGSLAAHYCFDHATVDGLVYPTLRRVVRRTATGAQLFAPTGVLLQLSDLKAT